MLDFETSVSSKERSMGKVGSVLSFEEGLIGPNEPVGGASRALPVGIIVEASKAPTAATAAIQLGQPCWGPPRGMRFEFGSANLSLFTRPGLIGQKLDTLFYLSRNERWKQARQEGYDVCTANSSGTGLTSWPMLPR